MLADLPADVVPLYGDLPADRQDQALRASRAGARKVVLATSIAETSLTIEGVRVVIDAGLSRVPRYSPRTGMTRLGTVRVSRASADQRRGRAGRLGPGVCYRLWSPQEDAALPARSTPEILEADLAPLALELAAAGVRDPAELLLARSTARGGVRRGAVAAGAARGARLGWSGSRRMERAMARLALHPRLAHMVLSAGEAGARRTACELAALLSERDLAEAVGGRARRGHQDSPGYPARHGGPCRHRSRSAPSRPDRGRGVRAPRRIRVRRR